MEMSYKQLEKILISHFKILPDREGTFRSRIKQLQRMEFPAGVNVGRGAKMLYAGEHLFKLVTAFELIGAGLPALTATQIVDRHWTAISAGYALSALQHRWGYPFEHFHIYLAISVDSMHEIRFHKTAWPPPQSTAVKVVDLDFVARMINGKQTSGHPLQTYLAVSRLLETILDIARNQAGLSVGHHDDEFVAWLPKGKSYDISFLRRYPDQSNIEMRQYLHLLRNDDPNSLTPEGQEEAKNFIENVLEGAPF